VTATDAALIGRIGRGDRDALGELYRRRRTPILRVGRRVTRSRELAEEVVQESFLDVWRTAARFDPGRGAPEAWLVTIAHRRAVDAVRRERTRRLLPASGDDGDHSLADLPDDRWESLQRVQVRRALATLSDRQREVIELSYFGGFSQLQLARSTGLPLGTIKSRAHSGLARLRIELERGDGSPVRVSPFAGTAGPRRCRCIRCSASSDRAARPLSTAHTEGEQHA
jgi:RNA polymerase sigma-70 factor (ECF subfamily)